MRLREHKRTWVLGIAMLLVGLTFIGSVSFTGFAADYKVGMVTDMGGVDDKSFNETSWNGIQDAVDQLGVQGRVLESNSQADYAKNIREFANQDYDMIVTVGFLLADATAEAAAQNPDTDFAIVDFSYGEPQPNVKGLLFETDEAAFLAGYAAADLTETGVVGTFGGLPIPTVTIFMEGYEAGVKYYNQVKGTNVQVLGWSNAKGSGLFTGDFENTNKGYSMAVSLYNEGADIIMPVAGPVGLGAAAAAKDRGIKIIGVDTDWFVSANEYRDVLLTSVVKKMDVAVFDAIKSGVNGNFEGGAYLGTLANGGVELAPFHDFADQVPDRLKAELDDIEQQIIDGQIDVDALVHGK